MVPTGTLQGKILISTYSHALILSIDTSKAERSKGVHAVITGKDVAILTGPIIQNRPPLAIDDEKSQLKNSSLRTYKLLRYGEEPEYIVDFIESPQNDGPLGARGMGEHGILAIPSAFANAISRATEEEFDSLPISPESIWKAKRGGKYDTF